MERKSSDAPHLDPTLPLFYLHAEGSTHLSSLLWEISKPATIIVIVALMETKALKQEVPGDAD